MQSHVWHQGDVYPVATAVVPFLLRLIAAFDEGDHRSELEEYLEVLAETAGPGALRDAIVAGGIALPVDDEPLPPPAAADAPAIEATVLFVGAALFTARLPDGDNTTVRCQPVGLRKGHPVQLVISGGVVRSASWTDADGAAHRVDFDPSGNMVAQ